ncbi:hypothetical protein BaRGS_00006400 [Batillaria attramentaria]|uniref:Uncharacterized protein n=1 Tax=Batillaria attramentaria TaxID=370345 RepID=A0ABD0LSU6_9CAEN
MTLYTRAKLSSHTPALASSSGNWQLPPLARVPSLCPLQNSWRTLDDRVACIRGRSEAGITNLSGAKTPAGPIGKQLKSEIVDRTIFGPAFSVATPISDPCLAGKHGQFHNVLSKTPCVAFH